MGKDSYYLKLQELIDKVKSLKDEIERSDDKEKIGYLKLAMEAKYEEIRELMENNK